MNELEQLARLRDEVPLESSRRMEDAVLAQIATPGQPPASRTRAGARGAHPARRWMPRPVIAGALALAVGAGTAIGIGVTRSSPQHPAASQVIAWSGRPTAPWPGGQPSYGRPSTGAQLVDYATRAAMAAPGRAPKSDEWVVTRVEEASSSGGDGGYMFGPPDERQVYLQWHRGDGCASTQALAFPASLAPTRTVSGKVAASSRLVPARGQGCAASLFGWKSVSYAYLSSLPTDPAALEKVIVRSEPPGGLIPTQGAAVFDAIQRLLADGQPEGVVVPPKLEAAFYRLLLQLPGVHFEAATDLAGRSGLGFWVVAEGYLKEEIVIDPDTYQYLGDKSVAIKDNATTGTDGTRQIKAGHVTGWEALLGSAIVQRPGQLP